MTGTRSPWCIRLAERRLTLRETALFGILGGMTFLAKMVMAGLPNIEPVSLMVMLFAVTFGRKALYPIYAYVLLEFVLYGLNLWSVNYLYIWLILAAAAWLLRGMTHPLGWALLSACSDCCSGCSAPRSTPLPEGGLLRSPGGSAASPTIWPTARGILS